MKYIITADHNGVPYYMQIVVPDSPNLPPFVWNGLINNATTFLTFDSAKKTMEEMLSSSKLPMRIKKISAYGMKAEDVFNEPPPPIDNSVINSVIESKKEINFNTLDSFFQKHLKLQPAYR